MPCYRLTKSLIPAAEGGAYAIPTQDLFAVTSEMDQVLNRIYVTLVMAAGKGAFGPFTPEQVVEQFARDFPPLPGSMPLPTAAQASKALRRLVALGLVVKTD